MKEIFGGIIVTILGLVLVVGLMFGGGAIGNLYDRTINKESVSIQREKFKESKSYVEGMINSLSEYKREYERAETNEEKEQVANLIDSKFSNFDSSLIENDSLYKFLMDVRNGNL